MQLLRHITLRRVVLWIMILALPTDMAPRSCAQCTAMTTMLTH